MSRKLHKVLNAALPMGVRKGLKESAKAFIPTLRHLDMPVRLRHLASRGFAPGVIYDVGAATGEWSRMAHEIWPQARIVGFEPNAREVPHLDATKRDVPGFDYRRCFLGRARGTVEYFDNDTQTSLLDDSARGVKTTAEMLVLDELIASGDIPAPQFVKLDVQGYELEVLSGGEAAMRGAQALLLEVSFIPFHPGLPIVRDVVEFMHARGFVWFDVLGLLRRASDDALLQMDVLFVRGDSPLRAGGAA
ncbi:MAG: FkbM family methyltransferase [Planctomycetota bacterium]|nr:FkbM family methyltransferase [Planctomycetota bacterium]